MRVTPSDTDDVNRRNSSTARSELEREAWPRLGQSVVELLKSAGATRQVDAGEVVFEVGQPSRDFVYIERGSVDVVDRADDRVVVRIDAGHFVGELGMLTGQRTFYAGVVSEPARLVVVPVERLRALVATVPELGDAVVSAFAARRQLLTQWQEGGLVIVGDELDALAVSLRTFATRNGMPHRWVNRSDSAAIADLERFCELPGAGAAVVTGRNQVLSAPTARQLAVAIGLDLGVSTNGVEDVLVVGAGPAGLAAAVYGASEGLRTLVIDDTAVGGQAGTSSRIENYLGFPKGISGSELAGRAFVQAVKFGARILAPRAATALHSDAGVFVVTLDDGTEVRARAVILAGGAQYRRLSVDGIESFDARGVSYAATEIEARACAGTRVVVVGGGNSAGQAAMFLSRHASHVEVWVRGQDLSATMSQYLAQRLAAEPRIDVLTSTELTAVHGTERLSALTMRRTDMGVQRRVEVGGLFVMIGAVPRSGWVGDALLLDGDGFVLTGTAVEADAGPYETSIPGIFAVGDLRAGSVKRVASAVGEGSVVIAEVHRFLSLAQVWSRSLPNDEVP